MAPPAAVSAVVLIANEVMLMPNAKGRVVMLAPCNVLGFREDDAYRKTGE